MIAMAAILLTAGMAKAQVVDTAAQYQQNQLHQQELQRQQEEADKAAREAAREQARIEKEQAQAQKEQARMEKEQAKIEKANEKAAKEQKAAEKKARKEARKEAFGRGLSFDFDLNANLGSATRVIQYGDMAHIDKLSDGGIGFGFNYPIRKRLDFGFGIGYQFAIYNFSHNLTCDGNSIDTVSVTHSLHRQSSLSADRIMVPLRLIYYDRDLRRSTYLGLNVGYSLHNVFQTEQVVGNDRTIENSWNNTKIANPWRLELVMGITYPKILFIRPSIQLYYSLLPTFVGIGDGSNKIHEFGLRLHL